MSSQKKHDKEQIITCELIDNFIRSIQAMHFTRMKRYLGMYGKRIVNCLQSRTRMPSLYFAIQLNDQSIALSCIKQLIKFEANVYFRDTIGNTFLHHCCYFNKPLIFRFLQEKLEVNQKNIYAQSVLYIISKNNQQEILQYLTSRPIRIEVNQADIFGRTALFYAAEQGNIGICEVLLKMGASVNIVDNQGHAIQYYAKRQSKLDVVQLISSIRKQSSPEPQPEQELITYNLAYIDDDLNANMLSILQVLSLVEKEDDLRKMLENPECIELPLQRQYNWKREAEHVVNLCLLQDNCEYFEVPVIQECFGISDYYQVIEKPMDFATITKKLTHNVYQNKTEFEDDVMLILENCVTYNGEDHYVTEYAKKIIDFFKSVWKY